MNKQNWKLYPSDEEWYEKTDVKNERIYLKEQFTLLVKGHSCMSGMTRPFSFRVNKKGEILEIKDHPKIIEYDKMFKMYNLVKKPIKEKKYNLFSLFK